MRIGFLQPVLASGKAVLPCRRSRSLSRGYRGISVSHNPLVSRGARCRALAAQVVKGSAWEGRGNPCAALRSAPGLREPQRR
jgi:hypothetical protein